MYVVYKNHLKPTTIERISLDGKRANVLVDQKEVFYPTGEFLVGSNIAMSAQNAAFHFTAFFNHNSITLPVQAENNHGI